MNYCNVVTWKRFARGANFSLAGEARTIFYEISAYLGITQVKTTKPITNQCGFFEIQFLVITMVSPYLQNQYSVDITYLV